LLLYSTQVNIDKDKQPRLQINDRDALAIDSAEVTRDVEHSTLTNVMRDGRPVTFAAGDRVTLWVGPPEKTSIVFMGKAVDEHDVLDLISTESDDELEDYESI
jgi:hypothetical protein